MSVVYVVRVDILHIQHLYATDNTHGTYTTRTRCPAKSRGKSPDFYPTRPSAEWTKIRGYIAG